MSKEEILWDFVREFARQYVPWVLIGAAIAVGFQILG